MSTKESRGNPVARSKELVLQSVGQELLVYDLQRHKAHCLNDTAARVWRYCDGTHSVTQIAKRLQADLGVPCDEALVWYALGGLRDNELMDAVEIPQRANLKRREALRLLGLGGLIAVPLIASIPSPAAAQAASCVSAGGPCGFFTVCCGDLVCCPSGPAAGTCQADCPPQP